MKHFKRFIILLICIITAFSGFMTGFFGVGLFCVYGYSVPSDYIQVSDDEKFTQCFLAYCRSRDTDIVGGSANVIASFTYNAIVKAASQLGIDITRLQAELFYKQEANQGIQWFMTSTGVSAFNEIFAQLIYEAGLEVGDSGSENLYSGYQFTDDNGNSCLCTVIRSSSRVTGGYRFYNSNNDIISVGTQFIYPGGSDAKSRYDNGDRTYFTFNYNGRTYTYTLGRSSAGSGATSEYRYYGLKDYDWGAFYIIPRGTSSTVQETSLYPSIVYNIPSNGGSPKLHLGVMNYNRTEGAYDTEIVGASPTPLVLNIITINNSTVSNEYQGDTIINNEGDIIYDDDTTINYNPYPDNPNYDPNNPSSGTTTGPSNSNGSDGLINFPNIDFNLPEINWSLGDLSNKFPFSIPFDLVQLVTVLDAPAEAPRFEGTVNFGFTTWDYDINLESFDVVASVCRTAELVLFIFGLILITRNLIKG